MSKKALVVIDMQNDITKHYRDIIGNINAAVEWTSAQGMAVVYIRHHMTAFSGDHPKYIGWAPVERVLKQKEHIDTCMVFEKVRS